MLLLQHRNNETKLFVLAFPSMRGTIICGAIFGFVSSKIKF